MIIAFWAEFGTAINTITIGSFELVTAVNVQNMASKII